MVKTDLHMHLQHIAIDPDLKTLINRIAIAGKYISAKIHESTREVSETFNSSGEQQLALDVAADRILIEHLEQSRLVRHFASEEQDKIIDFAHRLGKYSVVADPLDGSSNVDTNLSVGTIIGIHEGELDLTRPRKIIAAMYIIYGPLTTLVYTIGQGVHEFVLNDQSEFILAQENLKLKEKGKIYAPGGNKEEWLPEHARYIDELEREGYKLRYSGTLVADVHQVLRKGGGVFTYPAIKGKPQGKLRALLELEPLAFIFREAGGKASTGTQDILAIPITKFDQRAPVYIGSAYEVEKAERLIGGRA